jgi:hypothetical protein
MSGDRLSACVHPEDLRVATRRDNQSQEESDQRRLARSIGTEATDDFPFANSKVQAE